MGAWHGMSARGRRGLGGRVQKQLASREPMARRPAHPRPVWVWGESVKFGRPRPSHPTLNVFLGGAWFWRGLPCARCCMHGAAVAGGGATTSNASCGWIGFPDFPLWSPTPLCPLHPLSTALPTAHSPTALAHPTLPQNHTHTHTPIRPSPSSLPTFPLSPPFHAPPRNPLHSPLPTARSPRPCPGNSALHHHQPGP